MKNSNKINSGKQSKENDIVIESDIRFFSLKYRMLITAIVMVLAYIFFQFFFYRFYLYKKISNEEQKYATKVMDTIKNAIEFNTSGIVALSKDWAEWDTMYAAVDNWTKDFEAENCPDSIFSELGLNYFFVLNKQGQVIYSKYYLPEKRDEVLDYSISKELLNLLVSEAGVDFSGIVLIDKVPVFFSSKAILHSDTTGPPNGRLVMGRVLDDTFIVDIGKIINEDVVFYKATLPCNCNVEGSCLTLSRVGNTIFLLFPLLDYMGNKVAHIQVTIKRNLFAIINDAAKWFIILSLFVFLILMTINSFLVEKFTLRRLRQMSEVMNKVKHGNTQFIPLSESGNDEITILQKSYNRMIKRIKTEEDNRERLEKQLVVMEKMATAGKITYNILHEINNPIRVIKNYLYAMEHGKCEQEYLQNIKNEIAHLSSITTQMLDFSKQEKILEDVVDLVQLLNDTIQSIEMAYQNKDFIISFMNNCGKALIKGHSGKLKQVFFNILKNAIEACGEKGQIEICLNCEGNMFAISIKDDGPGVKSEQIEKLFEPFYTRDKVNGLGLGLSISYNIVKNHGGDIYIDSNIDEGACFIVVLPKLKVGDGNDCKQP